MNPLVWLLLVTFFADEMRGTPRVGTMRGRVVTVRATVNSSSPAQSSTATVPTPATEASGSSETMSPSSRNDRSNSADSSQPSTAAPVPAVRAQALAVRDTASSNDAAPSNDAATGNRASVWVEVTDVERQPMARPLEPRWWLGVNCAEVPAPLKEHLNLENGLIVACVAPESPAQRAGVQANDILLTFRSVPIRDTNELMGLIESAGGESAELEVLRAGRRQQLSIAPERRPESEPLVLMVDPNGHPLDTESQAAFERLLRSQSARSYSLVLVRPGLVIDREYDAVDGDRHRTFFPLPNSPDETHGMAWTLGSPFASAAGPEFQEMSPWVSRNLRWQNDQVQIGETRIMFFPDLSDAQPVTWVGGEAFSVPGINSGQAIQISEGNSILAFAQTPTQNRELEIRLSAELSQWKHRTQTLEAQVELMRAEIELLKAHLNQGAAGFEPPPAPAAGESIR